MQVIGLTGSIGTGKSAVATMLKDKGIPVHDADATVHQLLESDAATIQQLEKYFPEAIESQQVNRKALRKIALGDLKKMKILEGILHPKVKTSQQEFLAKHRERQIPLVVLEIPLLYEKGYQRLCDYVIVVTCSAKAQQQRLYKRPNLTHSEIDAILSLQWSSEKKVSLADYVINTTGPKSNTLEQLEKIMKGI
ncbi:MAG: dephospho-CoA kinase [Pseudomonadota bacterium]